MTYTEHTARDGMHAARVSTLPRWAQQHIANLERKVAELQIEVTRATTGDDCDKRNAWVTVPDANGRSLDPYVPSRHREVRFMLGGHALRDFIDVRMMADEPTIYVSGGDRLSIMPASSNVVTIGLNLFTRSRT